MYVLKTSPAFLNDTVKFVIAPPVAPWTRSPNPLVNVPLSVKILPRSPLPFKPRTVSVDAWLPIYFGIVVVPTSPSAFFPIVFSRAFCISPF